MEFKGKHAGVLTISRRAAAMSAMVLLCILLSPVCRSSAEEIQAATMMEALKKADIHGESDTKSKVIGQLEQGEKIFAVELTEGGWYRVVWQGDAGYVKKDFLKIYSASEWDTPKNAEATGPSGKIINPEEEFKKITEAIKKRSTGVTISVFAGAVLLIVIYGVYVVAKERKEAERSEIDGMRSEKEEGGAEDEYESEDGGMEFLDLEQESESDGMFYT